MPHMTPGLPFTCTHGPTQLPAPPQTCSRPHHPLLQLIQVLQPRQNNLLTRLLDFARQEHLVEDGVHLVKVEYEVQLAHVAEEGVQHLDEEVDGLEVRELVVVRVDARAEEEARVAAVDDLVGAELDEVGLVLLVAGGYEAVDLGGLLEVCSEREGDGERVGWGEDGRERTSPLSFIFSSSLYGAYHFASRVLPLTTNQLPQTNWRGANRKRETGAPGRGGFLNSLPVLYQYEVQHRRVCWPPMRRGWKAAGWGGSRRAELGARGDVVGGFAIGAWCPTRGCGLGGLVKDRMAGYRGTYG